MININGNLILDGAMGTLVMQRCNIAPGYAPELLNIENPEVIMQIHKDYLVAGADVINTNTFGANRFKLNNFKEVISKAFDIATSCAKGKGIAFDIGPTGKLYGEGGMTFDECYNAFKEVILAGEDRGDFIYLETFTDLRELRIAVIAAKENSKLPIIASMSFSENMRTPFGSDVDSFVNTVLAAGSDGIGANCGLGADKIFPIAERMRSLSDKPIFIKANAGMPKLMGKSIVYDVSAEDFASQNLKIKSLGVNAVGGCCGTTPEYIEELKKVVSNAKIKKCDFNYRGAVCCSSKTVYTDSLRVVGERINPTGKKRFQQALLEGDYDYISACGIKQEEEGAEILDVNVGINGIDEGTVMTEVIKRLEGVTNLPLQIDSSSPEVLERALRRYCGKAIVNSVNASSESLNSILPIVAKYGAAVIGLTLDENGIPETAKERVLLAEKIVNRCLEYGINKEDVFIDALTLAEASKPGSAEITLEAVKGIKKLGVKTVLGVSNISFGMPARSDINAAFLKLAIKQGLDMCIINPSLLKVEPSKFAFAFLKGEEKAAEKFIEHASGFKEEIFNAEVTADLKTAIISGQKELASKIALNLKRSYSSMEIVEKYIIPALNEVGEKYEKGVFFLPQLISAADAAKFAFAELSGEENEEKSNKRFVLATVKGDVHDIGKNIVKAVSANYGYKVIDLGKDTDFDLILKAVKENYPCVLGLSALMTTTVNNMEATIKLVKKSYDIPILVGGAVLTKEYAEKIGGIYCSDANATVKELNRIFSENKLFV